MLSGISHDLRTPLTRLKLQLAMIDQKELSQKMTKDIDEMEKMLNNYLEYAKTQIEEKTEKFNLNELINEIKIDLNNKNFFTEGKEEIYLIGRKNSLKRCFQNIVINGLTYGEKIYLKTEKTTNRIIILFDDNGPGIPIEQYANVFKPFYRLDKSRSLNKLGVGLGLAIVEDIVNSHGGNIRLSKSKFNGLQVKVSLPF